ncbi:AraC family transcriptional regulator, partial [Flavobacterium sp.]|uniref:helix-turn-helix domain-containing protein n=1 Tax=Flavobacterium sp. TaxID=239 RepID=UPI00286BDC76
LLALKKYKKIYLENYTNADTINYKWLLQMTLVFLTAHLFVVSKMILTLTQNKDVIILSNIVVSISALAVTSWIVMKALYQPQLFRGIEIKLEPVETILQEENKIDNIEINAEISQKIETIKKFMREKEPFLVPTLTIQELASQIDLPQKELSVLINHHIGQHFFDFVNEYRIQKAMKILQTPTKKEFTVLEILYEVGFNSKSSFNTAFKKYTNQTPTEFRKRSLSTK